MDFFEFFHFMRPLWLLPIIPIVIFWYLVRSKSRKDAGLQTGIASHLAAALSVGRGERGAILPIDGVTILGVLLALGASGPTWSKVPNPLIAETAPLIVVLKVTPSMETPDLAPSRLERAKFKILDVITGLPLNPFC